MFDLLLTGIVLVLYFFIILFRLDFSDNAHKRFMSIDYTNTLKGLACIVIVFVHIPLNYQNKLQDAVGSFAYIGVTLFMLFSGYGIAYGVKHKNNFFHKFIQHRLLVVLIPFAISIILKLAFGLTPFSGGTGYIWVLLLFYILSFIAYKLEASTGLRGGYWKWVVCALVIFYSIIGRIGYSLGWFVEALGFMYGIILDGRVDKLRNAFRDKKLFYIGLFTLVSGIFGVAYLKYKPIPVYGDYLLRIVLGIALILWIFAVTTNFSPKNKISTWLGDHSFEIYLYHGFVMELLNWIANCSGIKFHSGVFIVLTFVITFVLSIPMHILDQLIISELKSI